MKRERMEAFLRPLLLMHVHAQERGRWKDVRVTEFVFFARERNRETQRGEGEREEKKKEEKEDPPPLTRMEERKRGGENFLPLTRAWMHTREKRGEGSGGSYGHAHARVRE